MQKIRVVTYFSGYDSQCLALNRLKQENPDFDYELVAWAEIDKHACTAHDALFSQWKDRNLGDVSKVDWAKYPTTTFSPCPHPAKTSPRLACNAEVKRAAAHARRCCGSVHG